MKMHVTVLTLLAQILLVLTPQFCSAAVLIGNYPQSNDGKLFTVTGSAQLAVEFTTPASPSGGYTVNNVILRLFSYGAGDTPAVGVFTSSGGAPGSSVGSFSNPGSGADGDFTFAPSGTISLAASTSYFLLVDATAGSFEWRGSDPRITPTGDASFGPNQYKWSFDDGASYPFNWTDYTTFQINATPVPEPATVIALCSMLVPALAIAVRRRKKL